MINEQQEIEQLERAIAEQERAVARLDAEILELEREIDTFKDRYEKVVGFAEKRLQAAQELLRELQRTTAYTPRSNGLPANHIPVEEQYKERWKQAPLEPEPPPTIPEVPVLPDLKQLYRSLARMYHPDFAIDETDRTRRTHLMALINEAYEQGDAATLKLIQSDEYVEKQDSAAAPDLEKPLSVLKLAQLRHTHTRLSVELIALQAQHNELIHSPWMQLKLDEKLMKMKGRDLFNELLTNFNREFVQLQTRIDKLRGKS